MAFLRMTPSVILWPPMHLHTHMDMHETPYLPLQKLVFSPQSPTLRSTSAQCLLTQLLPVFMLRVLMFG